MIVIGGEQVTASWTEYGAVIVPGTVVECDSLEEAQRIAGVTGGDAVTCRHYVTGWREVERMGQDGAEK